jgi:hypothetical protein
MQSLTVAAWQNTAENCLIGDRAMPVDEQAGSTRRHPQQKLRHGHLSISEIRPQSYGKSRTARANGRFRVSAGDPLDERMEK